MQGLVILGSLFLMLYWYQTRKKDINKQLALAAAISLLWVSQSGLYGYRLINYTFLDINMFAFVAWTAGLVIVKEWYESINWKKYKFLKFSLMYMVAMIAVEYIGYNWMGIKLETNYPGIFGIEAMHMPLFGQIYYLLIGPAYIKICEALKIK